MRFRLPLGSVVPLAMITGALSISCTLLIVSALSWRLGLTAESLPLNQAARRSDSVLLPEPEKDMYVRARSVRADRIGKIIDIGSGPVFIHLDSGTVLVQPKEWVWEHQPKPGMYLTTEAGGFAVWPVKLFESVHRRVEL